MKLKVCTGILILVVIQVALAFPKARPDKTSVREQVKDEESIASEIQGSEVIKNVPKIKAKRHSTPPVPERRAYLKRKEVSTVPQTQERSQQLVKDDQDNVDDIDEFVDEEQFEEEEGPLNIEEPQELVPNEEEQIEEEEQNVAEQTAIKETALEDIKKPEEVQEPVNEEDVKVATEVKAVTEETAAGATRRTVDQVTRTKKRGRKTTAQTTKDTDVNSLIRGSKAYRDALNWCKPEFAFHVEKYPCWERCNLASKYICYPQCDHPCVSLQPLGPFTPTGAYNPWSGFPSTLPNFPGGVGTTPVTGSGQTKDDKKDDEKTTVQEEEEEDDEEVEDDEEEDDEEEDDDDETTEEDEEDAQLEESKISASRQQNGRRSSCTCICRKRGKKGCQYINIGGGKKSKKGKNVYVVIVN